MPSERRNALLFSQGQNYNSYDFLGAHLQRDGSAVFRVWAPNAAAVALVGAFGGNGTSVTPMLRIPGCDIYECTAASVRQLDEYHYLITAKDGKTLQKSDPFAFYSQLRPGRKSLVFDIDGSFCPHIPSSHFVRNDTSSSPINIYEVHLGSWRKGDDGGFLNYRELADELAEYAADMGYTHVELLPISEHPLDASWGYQVTGYFAPTSRHGTPSDFRYFVDRLHQSGIGVILDWVPAHFPTDDFGLYRFDGGLCYEDPDPFKGVNPDWGTVSFDFSRPEVQSFLISSAMFWLYKYDIDGLRVDAVAAMLYSSQDSYSYYGEPEAAGASENPEAVNFIKKLTDVLSHRYPDRLIIAEDSTAWPGVTKSCADGGLGFTHKWNMGWMNDTLSYFSSDFADRPAKHRLLTFSLTYAFSERFILPVSHDEVVHGKRSLLGRMPGSQQQRFACLRAFLAYMMAHPGGKLGFMGYELAEPFEWDENLGPHWELLNYPEHLTFKDYVKALNHIYLSTPALWQQDGGWNGFRWVAPHDSDDSVLVFKRIDSHGDELLCAFNFSPYDIPDYHLSAEPGSRLIPLLDTDSPEFGGKGTFPFGSIAAATQNYGFRSTVSLQLPALSARYYKISLR